MMYPVFLQGVDSIKELLQLLKNSYFFNSLEINYEKSEVCGIGSKKGAVRAFSSVLLIWQQNP